MRRVPLLFEAINEKELSDKVDEFVLDVDNNDDVKLLGFLKYLILVDKLRKNRFFSKKIKIKYILIANQLEICYF